jgi:hypothetical protein
VGHKRLVTFVPLLAGKFERFWGLNHPTDARRIV